MKNIALIYFHPLSSIDGATKVIKSYVENSDLLNKNGVNIDVFAPTQYSGLNYNDKSTSGNIIKKLKEIVFKLDFAGEVRMMYNLYVRSRRAVKLYEQREGHKEYDAVFIHDLLTCYSYLKHGDGKPVLLVMHTTGDLLSMTLTYYPLLRYTLFYNIVLKKAVNTVLNKVNKIVFNSQLAKETFNKLYPSARPDLASFVNNGVVDLENKELISNHPAYPPYYLACVGSISERKGQRFIVEAMSDCSETERRNVNFIFVGDGEIRKELEEQCVRENIQNHFEFCGLQKDVVPFLKKANIFILPSVDEGMPISILEAMRQGLPVVSTIVGGIPYQVIDGETGVLIDASTKGVKHIIKHIDEYDWDKMGIESRNRYVQEFGIEQMMNKYSELLTSIC